MKIEAVTVCIDYSDHLVECITNRQYIDRWMIVTHPRDRKTIEICKKHGIEYTESERIYDNGSFFAKGKAINDGLECLDKDGWLLHIDADQRLPSNFTTTLTETNLNPECIYGARRQYNQTIRTEINPATEEEHQRPLVGFF